MRSGEERCPAGSADSHSHQDDSVVHFVDQSSTEDAVEGGDEKRPFKAQRANTSLPGAAHLDGPAESVLACGFSTDVKISAGFNFWHSEKQAPAVLPIANSSFRESIFGVQFGASYGVCDSTAVSVYRLLGAIVRSTFPRDASPCYTSSL